ncbi:hypothetical protein FS611_11685 [Escherichia coli]|nr:hypothetical protein FS611_11685 [Escherichia coli]
MVVFFLSGVIENIFRYILPERKFYPSPVNSLTGNLISKRLVRTVLIFTESSDQLSRATDRVPGLPASPGYVQ